MKLEQEFRVDVPRAEAWKVLLDLERIAPCMPGAKLTEVEGDEYRGTVTVKVGPITASYKGAARIIESDEAAGRVVLKADGRDTRGQGNASATITATLADDGPGTTVNVETDLNVSGKVAQLGRGVMADVSAKLLRQFVSNLERDVLAGAGTLADAEIASDADSPAVAATAAPEREPEPIDLLDAAGGAIVKRLVPIGAALVGLLVLRACFRRKRRA